MDQYLFLLIFHLRNNAKMPQEKAKDTYITVKELSE